MHAGESSLLWHALRAAVISVPQVAWIRSTAASLAVALHAYAVESHVVWQGSSNCSRRPPLTPPWWPCPCCGEPGKVLSPFLRAHADGLSMVRLKATRTVSILPFLFQVIRSPLS